MLDYNIKVFLAFQFIFGLLFKQVLDETLRKSLFVYNLPWLFKTPKYQKNILQKNSYAFFLGQCPQRGKLCPKTSFIIVFILPLFSTCDWPSNTIRVRQECGSSYSYFSSKPDEKPGKNWAGSLINWGK